MRKVVNYIHHDWNVAVYEDLKGKHAQHCLCWDCVNFTPKDRNTNCKIANTLYNLNVLLGITTPVWECHDYQSLSQSTIEEEKDE